MSVQEVGAKQAAVTGAIRTAAKATGVNFNYLLATAKVESDLDPNLTMRTSSATGLFQFLEQTWLGTMKQAGPAFGYGNYASAITKTASGRYEVADPALRREIMQLRKDPTANALMGGAFTQQNQAVLSQRIGRKPTEGELYIGHFFGPYAGAKAINLAASNPTANAVGIFPEAARANRSIFYDRQGSARSIAGVCAELTRRYQDARAGTPPSEPAIQIAAPVSPAAVQLADAPGRPPAPIPNVAAPKPFRAAPSEVVFSPPRTTNVMAYAPESAPAADGQTQEPSLPERTAVPRAERTNSIFGSLFHAGARNEPVSPLVTSLWTTPLASPADAPGAAQSAAAPAQPPSGPAQSPPNSGALRDLFRDLTQAAPSRRDGRI
jgi:hypothetical protein